MANIDPRLHTFKIVEDVILFGNKYQKNSLLQLLLPLAWGNKGAILDNPMPNITVLLLYETEELYKKIIDILKKCHVKKKVPKTLKNERILYDTNLDHEMILNYWINMMSCIVLAFIVIESHINHIITESDIIYEKRNSKEGCRKLNADEIVRQCSIEEKIQKVIPLVDSNKFNSFEIISKKSWDGFQKLKQFRNEIIHPKRKNIRPIATDHFNTLWDALLFTDSKDDKRVRPPIAPVSIVKKLLASLDKQKTDIPAWLQ